MQMCLITIYSRFRCSYSAVCRSPTGLLHLYRRTASLRKDGYTLVTLPRIVTPYRDSADGTRDRVTYQKLVTR